MKMTQEKSLLLKFLGDTPQLRMVDFLLAHYRLAHYRYDYSKKEIAKGAGIAISTPCKVWRDVEDFNP